MKKITSLLFAFVLMVSMSVVAFAEDNGIPADLPEGTIKIMDGVYAYTPPVAPASYVDWTNIGTVPAYGTSIQPGAFSSIRIETNVSPQHNYIQLQANKQIRINFIGGGKTIFGQMSNWPQVGTSSNTVYYFEAGYNGIERGVNYQLECTSTTSSARTNVEMTVWTSSVHS